MSGRNVPQYVVRRNYVLMRIVRKNRHELRRTRLDRKLTNSFTGSSIETRVRMAHLAKHASVFVSGCSVATETGRVLIAELGGR